MRETPTHIYFWNGFMSNWFILDKKIKYDRYLFDTSEQMFMFYKAIHFQDKAMAIEIATKGQDPKVVKAMGRRIKNFDNADWEYIRETYMVLALEHKFKADPKLLKDLLNTGNKILVEGSPFDTIWGVGLHYNDDLILDEKNWKGSNLLGESLMKVRKSLSLWT